MSEKTIINFLDANKTEEELLESEDLVEEDEDEEINDDEDEII